MCIQDIQFLLKISKHFSLKKLKIAKIEIMFYIKYSINIIYPDYFVRFLSKIFFIKFVFVFFNKYESDRYKFYAISFKNLKFEIPTFLNPSDYVDVWMENVYLRIICLST